QRRSRDATRDGEEPVSMTIPAHASGRDEHSGSAAHRPDMLAKRLMVMCAHPDDELSCAGLMARTVSERGTVTLVTCTLGERGEVVVPELEYLRSDRDDTLGAHRLGELT